MAVAFFLLSVAFTSLCSAAEGARAEQRNVLVLLVDDGGFESSIYGNTKCKTPNVDALAKRSLVFKNAFTSVSSCSPSRSVLLTGMPQHQNGQYGLYGNTQHYSTFDGVRSFPLLLNQSSQDIFYGIIGKKHVGPETVYPFPFSYTEQDGYDIDQVGRNITLMNELVHKFLDQVGDRMFFLYIGIYDIHRAIPYQLDMYGQFCEHFGDGSSPQSGIIPDWHPVDYSPDDVEIPFFMQDTPQARLDLAAQYRTVSRMDQGVGLFLEALKEYGYENNTLVIYTADNGIPFPQAKTNLYDPGMGEPMMVSSPLATQRWGQETEAMASLTDIVPTLLDWFGMEYPSYTLNGKKVELTGQSLLPLLEKEPTSGWDTVYSSHNIHEITMYYPMRVMRNKQYKLIKNLNYKMPFPIGEDISLSPTFLDLINHSMSDQETHWFKTLNDYYYRDLWELYDLQNDPHELENLAGDPAYSSKLVEMQQKLHSWRTTTNDPWICHPEGVLALGKCGPSDNGVL